ncbi:hypothetical protein DBR47_20735 [Paucibacter sp. KBW04]|uniref:BufA1 family periplasmic bufferin-type metallophore n=1 Tax=Paucibacter sp. KBW04 TaxID=2153361 RepID=UPI000F57623C|nr:DUF2282 domain-containing protein [Paucibacter sp. KBW04]RQO55307.1 hypothetical protein DBR47_20735 [Paucibacter sp. KBW04]
MKTNVLIASALASVCALGLLSPASAAEEKAAKEKCYGISKAGQNDCANLSGSHSCAGQATAAMTPDEWKYVPKGSCKSLKGLSAAEAKAAMPAAAAAKKS